MNVQYAVKDERLYIFQVNAAPSRVVPFLSNIIWTPQVKHIIKVMIGKSFKGFILTREPWVKLILVKVLVQMPITSEGLPLSLKYHILPL